MKNTFLFLLLLSIASCSSPSAPAVTTAAGKPSPGVATIPAPTSIADSLQQAVATYIKAHATAFPGYEPVRWGTPAAYTKMSEAAIKGVVAMQAFDDALTPRNKALADYKAAVARHDKPARVEAIKGRYGKANKYNDSLLAIANGFIGVRDSTRIGTQIGHTYRAKSSSGATVLDSATFVVYPGGKVEQL